MPEPRKPGPALQHKHTDARVMMFMMHPFLSRGEEMLKAPQGYKSQRIVRPFQPSLSTKNLFQNVPPSAGPFSPVWAADENGPNLARSRRQIYFLPTLIPVSISSIHLARYPHLLDFSRGPKGAMLWAVLHNSARQDGADSVKRT